MNSPASETAIVIGSGFGGLAAALRLRAMGYEVEVWERGQSPGGRAAVFEQDGFTYDAGPTVITAPFLFDELYALFGEKREDHVEFLPVKPWYRMVDWNQRSFDYGGTEAEVRSEIAKFCPEDAAGYGKLLEHSRLLYAAGFTRLGDQPFHRLSTMLKCVPALLRLRGDRTVWQFVCRYLKDDSLRRFFSIQPLLVGGNPFNTSSLYSLIHYLEIKSAIWYPRGGTGQLVRSLVALAERHGVRFHCDRTVTEIEVQAGRVVALRAGAGLRKSCGLVVANNDPPDVYRRLIAPMHRKMWTDRRLDRLHYSMGLFVLYFGTDRTYPDVAHHTILFSERYRELLDDIFKHGKLADDPSLYLHRPAATDPGMAPPGRDAFYVLAPVPNLKTAIDWDVVGPRYAALILEQLEKRILPDLRSHVISHFFVTPHYFSDSLLSAQGSGFSISPILTQSAWFRFHNKSEDVAGLYFVGAGVHPGAGLPGVVTSAKVVENILLEEGEKVNNDLSDANQVLARHGRSFHLAARFLPAQKRDRATCLYAFCRELDDLADGSENQATAKAELLTLRSALPTADRPACRIYRSLGLNDDRPVDALLAALANDTGPRSIQTKDELVRYAHGVAGTVGLMMTEILGATDPAAGPHALDLGIAMQLINIARDVRDDSRLARIYLPQEWLPHGITAESLASDPVSAWPAVRQSIQLAEEYFISGFIGLHYLPNESRRGIWLAGRVYREI